MVTDAWRPNYDLIHSDPCVKFSFGDRNTLEVSGSGSCDIDDVDGNLVTFDNVEVRVRKVSGDVLACCNSMVIAREVSGSGDSVGNGFFRFSS